MNPGTREPGTLADLLLGLRHSDRAVVFPEQDETVPHREIPDRAVGLAGRLADAGVAPGDLIGLMVPTSPQFLPAFFAPSLLGAAVTALPLPPLVLDPTATARALLPTLERAGIRYLLACGAGATVAAQLAQERKGLRVVAAASAAVSGRLSAVRPAPDAPAVVQYSSGSTAQPKGVMLTHGAVMAGVSAITRHIRAGSDDVLVSWAPLFHDMGLIALLCSLLAPGDAHLFSPMAFLRRPGVLLERLAEVGGTITIGPDFSYGLLAAAADKVFPRPTGGSGIPWPAGGWH
ncbi:AMP-binding protein [Streptomyces sp. CA-249302]|uniref:AMP-binding protein n=1 Tax=Streptomyces sp. CA-249302 TaxID=3240058 RepID=UPI003D9357F3